MAEQQEDRAGGPDVEIEAGVGEALVKEVPVGVLVQADRVGLRAVRHEEVACVVTAVGPNNEVAGLVAGAGLGRKPGVEAALVEGGDGQAVAGGRGEKVSGEVDAGAGPADPVLDPAGPGSLVALGAGQQGPADVGAEQGAVLRVSGDGPFQVPDDPHREFVPGLQDLVGSQQAAQIVGGHRCGSAVDRGVEVGVGERAA
ncbi:hypothetical protein ACFU98_40000 [Streptomyces sp. NPDC057575]|uniref:hypothetical protein n=1 Tax=unclassified Streptomyces TaxID=2593676 RepID=UPI00369B9776